MHKIVNGKTIELTEKEKANVEASWVVNEEKIANRKLKLEQDNAVLSSALKKISRIAGLTLDEEKAYEKEYLKI